ncbi:MAG: hypothetical protein PHE02_04300 [Lachnospiraceae bacterium]|nr:hypothetical protein [Lachnospiraceae bacterium]
MNSIVLIVGCVLFLLSTLGYQAFLQETFRMSPNEGFLFLFSMESCIIFFGGLLGILPYVVYGLLGIGIALGLIFFIKDRCYVIFNLQRVNTMNVFFILFFIGVFLSLYQIQFIHYDNFSHWGVIVKYMLIYDEIPDAATAIIDYKDYPLGSASFLYYFCKIAGNSQGNMIVAQALLLFACFYAMFSVIRDTKRSMLISFLGTLCSLMTFFNKSIRINNLLVDFLLPLLALGAIAIIYRNRRRTWKAALISAPVLALLSIVKSSGIFFGAMVYCYLLYVACRKKKYHPQEKRGISLLTAVGGILLSMTAWAAWRWHMSTALAGVISKHASQMDKTPEVMHEIVSKYIQAVFDWTSLNTQGIFWIEIAVLIVTMVANGILKKKWQLWKVLLLLDVTLALYYGGILVMFLFNMPVDEAVRLAGFERYASSIVIFFMGCISMCAVRDVEKSFYIKQGDQRNYRAFKSLLTKKIYQGFSVFFVTAGSYILLSEINSMNYMQREYDDLLPAKVERVTGDQWSGVTDKKYLLYASDTDGQITDYYLQYVGRYFLFSPHVDAVYFTDREHMTGDTSGNLSITSQDALRQRLADYDYLVVVESDQQIEQYLSPFTDQSDVCAIYPTKDIIAR